MIHSTSQINQSFEDSQDQNQVIVVRTSKRIDLKDEVARLRRELLGSPVKFGAKNIKKDQNVLISKPIGNRKSFLFQLKKIRLQKEQQQKKKITYRDSFITDYFKTQRLRDEPAIEVCHYKSFLFEGIDENNLTVGQCESTFDGYNAQSSLTENEKECVRPMVLDLQHMKVFDAISFCSSGDNSLMHSQVTHCSKADGSFF